MQEGTLESLLPTKPLLSPTDTVRIVDNTNPAAPVSSQTPVSSFDARYIGLIIALS